MKLFNLICLCLGLVSSLFAQFEIKGYTKYIENPEESIISDDGRQLYACNNKGLRVYQIDATTHLLKRIQDLSQDGNSGVVMSLDNRFVITGGYNDNVLYVYKRNVNDGTLSLYKSYKNRIGQAVIEAPSNLTRSNNGRFICLGSGNMLLTLRFVEGELEYHNQFEVGSLKKAHFSPDNKHVFIQEYRRDRECPRTVLSFNEQMGTFEVVACLEWKIPVAGFFYDAENKKQPCFVIPSLDELAFSPDGKDVYVRGLHIKESGTDGAFAHYRWVNGELKAQKAYSHLEETYQIETLKNIYVDGSGDYLYILTGGNESGIHIFKRNQETGALTKVKSFREQNNLPRLATCYKMSFSANNQYAYVSNFFGGNIVVLKNNAAKPSPKKYKPNNNNQPKPIVNNTSNNNNQPQPIVNNTPSNNSDNSIVQESDCQHPKITTAEITRIEERIKNLNTEQARYDYALKILQNRCLETLQVLRLARLFEVEYMRLEFVKFAYYYTSDIESFYLLDTLFTNNRLKATFKKFIEG